MWKVLESCLTHHLSSIDVSSYILNIIVSRAPQRIPHEKLPAVRSPYQLWSRAGGESSSLGIVLFQMQNYAQQNGTKSTQNDPLATMSLGDVFGSSLGPSHFPPPQPSCPHCAWTTCLLTEHHCPPHGCPTVRGRFTWILLPPPFSFCSQDPVQISLPAQPGSKQWPTFPKVIHGSPITLPI